MDLWSAPGEPIDALRSPRLAHVPTFARLPLSRDLSDPRIKGVFLGVPFDTGATYYSGARLAPTYIRIESRLLRPYNYVLGVYPFKVLGLVDFGDVDVVPTSVEKTLDRVEEAVSEISSRGVTPFIAGGDHSISLGVLRGLRRRKPILVHFDSHLDYWDSYWGGERYTHGTWVRRAIEEGLVSGVVQIGIRGPQFSEEDFSYPRDAPVDFTMVTIYEARSRGFGWLLDLLKGLSGDIYVSFDIDVVDPAYAPGTGTREVGGFTSYEALELIRALAKSRGNLVGFDVVEVSPPMDSSNITSLLASNLLFEAASVKAYQVRYGL